MVQVSMKALRPSYKSMGFVLLCGTVLVLLLGSVVFSQGTKQGDQSTQINQSKRTIKAAQRTTPLLEDRLSQIQSEWGAPIFFRLVKRKGLESDGAAGEMGYLDAFVQSEGGTFKWFKRWDICTYSGSLGPKLKEGDGQSPEGFYFVNSSRLNPNSSYHLSFNLGFPNAYDRAHGRTGSFLMVHGRCVSIGCYAMTDDSIEEIYILLDASLRSGQSFVRVHIFPFPMTDENLEAQYHNPNYAFWQNLKEGWDIFEASSVPPNVEVRNKRYVFD